jgi:hypothetical protein
MRSLLPLGGLLAAAMAACLSLMGCYEATPLRLSVQSPSTAVNCARVADGVFFGAAYERMGSISGPDLFYTPRVTVTPQMTPMAQPGLGWGIGVWLKGREPVDGGRCGFELESLQADPMGGLQCLYWPQRGQAFDQALKEMARRLSVATR